MTEQQARELLALPESASPVAVDAAYRDLVHILNPDRLQGPARLGSTAERAMRQLGEAYTTLMGTPPPPLEEPLTEESVALALTEFPAERGAADEEPPRPKQPMPWGLVLIGTGVFGLAVGALATFAIWWPAMGGQWEQLLPRTVLAEGMTSSAAEMPASVPDPDGPVRPRSGDYLFTPAGTGMGILVLQNPGRRDAVVVLGRGERAERAVYVRTGEQATVRDMPSGTFQVRLMLGRDWTATGFSKDTGFERVLRAVKFAPASTMGEAERGTVTVAFGTESSAADAVAIEPFVLPPLQ
jgi:hypothetical protein